MSDERPAQEAPALSRFISVVGIAPSLAVPAWFTFSRLLTDTAGSLTMIFAVSAMPVLVTVYLLALLLPRRSGPRPRRRPGIISARAAALLIVSWCFGLSFGLTVPDLGAGASSVLVGLAGEEAAGISAAISNPSGILMTFFAALALGFSVVDARRASRSEETTVDDDALLASYGYTFYQDR